MLDFSSSTLKYRTCYLISFCSILDCTHKTRSTSIPYQIKTQIIITINKKAGDQTLISNYQFTKKYTIEFSQMLMMNLHGFRSLASLDVCLSIRLLHYCTFMTCFSCIYHYNPSLLSRFYPCLFLQNKTPSLIQRRCACFTLKCYKLTIVCFLCLSMSVRKHGLRRFLFFDTLVHETTRVLLVFPILLSLM